MKFKLLTVAPRQGLGWVRAGLLAWRQHPLAYTSLLMSFMLLISLVALVPVLGAFLMMLGVPLLTLAFMMATRAGLNGHRPGPGAFVAPWMASGPHRAPLAMLCVLYAALTLFTLWLGDWVDGGALQELMDTLNDPKASNEQVQHVLNAPGLLSGLLLRLTLGLLISLPFWHAPALVVWAGQGVAQAMFSSTLALWRARGAFTLYGLGWAGVMLATTTVLNLLTFLLGGGTLANVLTIVTGLCLTSAYYVSLFFSFQENFSVEA